MRTSSSYQDKEKSFRKDAEAEGKRPFRRKVCKFCLERIKAIDFRDTVRLSKFTSERGKILPRRVSGNCSRHQHQLSRAIKRSRVISLMPFVAAG